MRATNVGVTLHRKQQKLAAMLSAILLASIKVTSPAIPAELESVRSIAQAIPPTLAAAKKTYSGFSFLKKSATSA